jgi:tyrosine-protein kinase Etk/Wzc
VVDDTNTNSQSAERTTLLDLALLLAENARILVGIPLGVGILALAMSFLVTPTYTAAARILPPAQQQGAAALSGQLGALSSLIGGAAAIRNSVDQYVALIKSRTVLDGVIQRFKLLELYDKQYVEDARRILERRTRVSAGAKDGIITIEFDDKDPKRAADIANGFVAELRNLAKTLAITEAGQRRLFFETQLKTAKENLTKAEVTLGTSGVGVAVLKTVPQSALESLARLKAQITTQEIKLASMRTFMTESNPEYRLAQQELAALRGELAKAEASTTGQATGDGADYIARYRDFKYYETLFDLMAKQYEVARLDEAREGAVVQVVDVAVPPDRKSGPRKALIAVITTTVTFLGLVLILLARRSMQRASPEEAAKLTRLRELLAKIRRSR